jgi:hypothetical protein
MKKTKTELDNLYTIDMIGQRFGQLVVMEQVSPSKYGRRFRCQCDCGNTKIIRGATLRSGHTKSCSHHSKFPDIVGKKFGRLTVIKRKNSKKSGKAIRSRVECECECGKHLITWTTNIISGRTLSCGCLASELTSRRNAVASKNPFNNQWVNSNDTPYQIDEEIQYQNYLACL